MATSLVPDNWRVYMGNQVIDAITEQSNTAFYLFISQHVTNLDTVLPEALDDPQQIYIDVYHKMIAGKRITANDVLPMITNIPYVANTYYDMYDDGDPLLASKKYYAITNAGSFSHVWKCLDNNNQSNSTVIPNFADIDVSDELYQTSDGYRWKYMCSVDSTTVDKFGTDVWFPLVANSTVANLAISGAVDIIQVQIPGQGYNNYLLGTFNSGDIRVNGNTVLYGFNSNSIASTVNGFYTGCMLYISTGTGVGQYRKVVDYFSNPNGQFALVDSEFTVTPTNGDQFQVYPYVNIIGDGKQTSNAVARALVNAVGNSIYRVEMISRGAGYNYITANVIANNVVGVLANAVIRAVYSPPGGHGSNVAAELRAKALCFATKLSNSESNTIPATNQFQQYGILANPSFANVQVTLSGTNLNIFGVGETACKIATTLMTVGVSSISSNTLLTLAGGYFDQQYGPGDPVLLVGNASSTETQLATINTIINATAMTLTTNCLFTDSNTSIYFVEFQGNAKVISHVSNAAFRCSHLSAQWGTGDYLVGATSGATGYVNVVSISDVPKSFSTFVGMHKYTGAYAAGVFVQNETVYEGTSLANSTANASLHSAVSNGTTIVTYVSNQVGVFNSQLIGANSGAVFNIGTSYDPDIEFGSGRVLYLENISAVVRDNSHEEAFAVIYLF